MQNFMLDHAIRNVWCSPFQDDQAILELCRITSIDRAANYFIYQNRKVALPTLNEDYHVYVIGQNAHTRLNLVEEQNVWKSFAEQAVDQNLYSDIYLDSGLELTRKRTMMLRGEDWNYFIAIPMHEATVDLDNEKVYLRLYRNSYFGSDWDTSTEGNVLMGGGQIKDVSEGLIYQREYLAALAKTDGHAYAFLNGYMVDNFLPNEVKQGDQIEWVYDASIDQVVDFRLDELQSFTSVLDGLLKYVIHPPKLPEEQIEYHDDVDIWIVRKDPVRDRWRAVYFNKNSQKSVRMLTHRDYSIPTNMVNDLIHKQEGWDVSDEIYIRLHLRKSGYKRPLVDEHNRIHELYKLTDEEIVRAMVGIDATVPEWQVNTLESSNYTRIMRSFYQDITPVEVMYAYGYNAMAKMTADTPNRLSEGKVRVPVAHRQNSTVYEFNDKGLLVGWRKHPGGDTYFPMSLTTTMVEFIDGIGSDDSDFTMSNEGTVYVNKNEEYRFYACRVSHTGSPSQDWEDVTGDYTYYRIESDGEVTWLFNPLMYLGAVKGNSHFTSFDLTIEEHNHMYRFSLVKDMEPGSILMVPPARIDIWMNSRALIEHVDFHVNYPEIVIFNKEYLREGSQKFTIRGYGLVAATQERDLSHQRGYVQHGMVSVNNTYDVREDKVIRCVIDGRTFHRDDIKFAESQRAITVPGIADGRPYLIQDAIAPIRGMADYNTYPLRASAQEVDRRVSDYLTLKLPEELPQEPFAIPKHYWIFSPFLARVLYDLWAETLNSIAPEDPEEDVHEQMQPYLWLLDFDPCRMDYVDDSFVNIHAHPKDQVLTVTKATYRFLDRLNKLYLNSRVDLTPFLQIEGEGEDGGIVIPPEIPDPDPLPPAVYPWYIYGVDQVNVSLPGVVGDIDVEALAPIREDAIGISNLGISQPSVTDAVLESLAQPVTGIVLSDPYPNPFMVFRMMLSEPWVPPAIIENTGFNITLPYVGQMTLAPLTGFEEEHVTANVAIDSIAVKEVTTPIPDGVGENERADISVDALKVVTTVIETPIAETEAASISVEGISSITTVIGNVVDAEELTANVSASNISANHVTDNAYVEDSERVTVAVSNITVTTVP